MAPANDSLLVPCFATICRPGHMRPPPFGGDLPRHPTRNPRFRRSPELPSPHACRHGTDPRQISAAVPGGAAPPRPGTGKGGRQIESMAEPTPRAACAPEVPAGASRSSGSCAETVSSSTAAPAAASARLPAGPAWRTEPGLRWPWPIRAGRGAISGYGSCCASVWPIGRVPQNISIGILYICEC